MARPVGAFNSDSHSPDVLRAAGDLFTPDRAPTRREIAAELMLSTREIANTVDNLTRTGKLLPVRLRQVAHRSRPVAEYAPATALLAEKPAAQSFGWAELQRALAAALRQS